MSAQLVAAIGLLVLDLVESQRRSNWRSLPEGTEIREANVRRMIEALGESAQRIEDRMTDGADQNPDADRESRP